MGTGTAHLWIGLTLGLVWFMPSIAAGADPLVTITGGVVDVKGHNYEWIVKNYHSSPIVYVEFPHYRADSFTAPDGWSTETPNLVGRPAEPDKPQVCIARPRPPNKGIVRGASVQFGMRVPSTRVRSGKRQVKVEFADGTQATVPGVELPEPPEASARYIALIGTGVIFAGWVIVRTVRRRPSPSPDTSAPGSESEGHT